MTDRRRSRSYESVADSDGGTPDVVEIPRPNFAEDPVLSDEQREEIFRAVQGEVSRRLAERNVRIMAEIKAALEPVVAQLEKHKATFEFLASKVAEIQRWQAPMPTRGEPMYPVYQTDKMIFLRRALEQNAMEQMATPAIERLLGEADEIVVREFKGMLETVVDESKKIAEETDELSEQVSYEELREPSPPEIDWTYLGGEGRNID